MTWMRRDLVLLTTKIFVKYRNWTCHREMYDDHDDAYDYAHYDQYDAYYDAYDDSSDPYDNAYYDH